MPADIRVVFHMYVECAVVHTDLYLLLQVIVCFYNYLFERRGNNDGIENNAEIQFVKS